MNKLIASVLTFSASLVLAHSGDTDLERLQGTWLVTSLLEEGKALPAADIEILEIVINKDVFTVNEKGKAIAQYQIKLDPAKTPRQIDFTHLIGEAKGKTEPGIYAIDKDQVKFALNEKKKVRPTVFEGKETLEYSVIVLKRKPAK